MQLLLPKAHGRAAKPEEQQSQRLTDALFNQHKEDAADASRSSSSKRGSPSPRARCCSAWTSTPCRPPSSPRRRR